MNILMKLLDKVAFALEKLAALFASQRTIASMTGVAIITIMAWNIIAPLLGFAISETGPDDVAIEVKITALVAAMIALMTSVASILRILAQLVRAIDVSPPSLVREDYNGLRMQPYAVETKEEIGATRVRWESSD